MTLVSDLKFQWWECDAAGNLLAMVPGATTPAASTGTITSTKYYRCVVTCPAATLPNADTSGMIRVNVTPIVPPYQEDFETGTGGVNMACASYSGSWSSSAWYLNDAPNSSYPSLSNHTAGGKNYLFAGTSIGNFSNGMVARYWFTPAMQLTKGKSYKFTAWYVGSGLASGNEPWGQMSFYAGTAQTEAAMSLLLGDTIYSGADVTYRSLSRSFTAPATGVYYIGIKVDNMGNVSPGIAIDDLSLELNTDCDSKPVAGRAHATPNMICGSGTSILRAAGTTMASALTYQWQTASAAAGPWSNTTGGSGATDAEYTTATLSVAGPYYYRCIVTCSTTGTSDTTSVARLNVGYVTPPYQEDFERASVCTNTPCASAYSSGTANNFQTYVNTNTVWAIKAGEVNMSYPGCTNHTPGGLKHLVAGYNLGINYNAAYGTNYWFTPAIRLIKDSTYECSYWYAINSYASTTSVPFSTVGLYYGTAQTSAGMTTAIVPDLPGQANVSFKKLVGRFVAPSTNNFYFGIKVNHTGYMYYGMAIDDINVEQLPACGGIPAAGTISATPAMLCSPGATTLSMDMSGTSRVSGLGYYWQYTDTDPATGFVPTGSYGSGAAPLSGPLYTTGTLSATRWFRCVVKCRNTGDSTFSSVIRVDVGAITLPYIETFESGTYAVNQPCAAYTSTGGDSVFTAPTGSYWGSYTYWNLMVMPSSPYSTVPMTNHTPGGSKYLLGGSQVGNALLGPSAEYWFTPAIRLVDGRTYELRYWYCTDGKNSSGVPANYSLAAYLGKSQTKAAMTTLLGPDMANLNNTAYQQVKYRFTATASGNFYIGFRKGQAANGYGLALDDISLQEVANCTASVVAGTITTDPEAICNSGDVASLDLNGGTLSGDLNYTWQYKTAAGSWTTFTTSAPPVSTLPMRESAAFRCIVVCPSTGAADTTPVLSVVAVARDMPYVEDFERVNDKPLCSAATYWGTSGNDGWQVNARYLSGVYANHTPGGRKYLMAGNNLGYSSALLTDDNYWFTPALNLRAGYKYRLSFWYLAAYSSSYSNRMGVYYGSSQSVGAMTNAILPMRVFSNLTYQQFDTTFMVSNPGVYYLGFRKSAGTLGTFESCGIAFDDINVNYASCDGMPSAGTIAGSVSSGSSLCKGAAATLRGIGATIAAVPGIRYQWLRRGLAGAPPAAWTAIPGARDTVLKTDTLAGYEYRLAVICSNTHDTAFTPAYQLPATVGLPKVVISPSASPVTLCLGDTVHLTATSIRDGVYDWMLDSVVIPGWKFSDMNATEPGSYTVKVTAPASPCPAFSDPVRLDAVDPGFKVLITTPADSFVCAGTVVTLTATGSKPGMTYQWRKDNMNIPGATGSMYMVTSSGSYRVMASDGSSICLAASRSIPFTVKPNPPAVIAVPGGKLTACEEVGVLLQANSGAYSYQWSRSGSPLYGWVDSAALVTTPGTYSVKVRSADGCSSESISVTVNILPSPEPVIVVSGPSAAPTLGTTLSTYLDYMWIRNGATTDTTYAAIITATRQGMYRVIVTDANGCTGVSLPVELTDPGLGIGNVTVKGTDIRIFPNPTNAKVFIESPVSIRLEVKDIAGRTIIDKTDVTEVDMSDYADGIYMFVISDKAGKQLLKEQRVQKSSNK